MAEKTIKMKRIVFAFLITISCNATAQFPYVDTLNINAELREGTYNFPIIRTGNLKTDSIIEKDMLRRFTQLDFQGTNTDSLLNEWIGESITFVDFEVTYIGKDFVSLHISTEGCGANCSQWTEYFTYLTRTGEFISLDDILDTSSKLMKRIQKERANQYRQNSKDLYKIKDVKDSGVDDETIQWILESYAGCERIPLRNFEWHSDHIRVIDNCGLPNAIKAFTPVVELRYDYKKIRKYLKMQIL